MGSGWVEVRLVCFRSWSVVFEVSLIRKSVVGYSEVFRVLRGVIGYEVGFWMVRGCLGFLD